MAFSGNYSCNSFRSGLADGTVNLSSDTFKLALYTNAATLDQTTAAYTATGEVVATGYTAGGEVVTATVSTALTASGSVVYVSFSSPSWSSGLTARGALIYDVTSGAAICVLDFGSDKTSTSSFTVTMPANTSTSALIRIA